MVNLTNPELAEIRTDSLPRASLEALNNLRETLCTTTDFKLQPSQKFLRRVLSPDSPTRSLLMVHGTGTGKTCTAIQIAEEYILRPEFQDKKVMVVASRAVQENFRTQIFDMSRVNLDKTSNTLSSKQCTGRRYLDMLLRIESEPKNWANPEIVSRLETISDRIIKEFYEFSAYNSFGAMLNRKLTGTAKDIDEAWIHENFDNRLLIIDEAHNIRSKDATTDKEISTGLERLIKVANGMVIVLLTATPMFDSYEEIIFYMNLFLWNERKQPFKAALKPSDFFTGYAELKGGESEVRFREWCQEYVSFVKGESPFTFPFRLPPPKISEPVNMSFTGHNITDRERLKYLSLVSSQAQGIQQKTLSSSKHEDDDSKRTAQILPTISVLPKNQTFNQTFTSSGSQYSYAGDPCLTPDTLPNHSAKFVSIIKSIESSSGVVLVYSNFVAQGAKLFAMALEEHGYTPLKGETLMAEPTWTEASLGNYILLTSDASDAEISAMLSVVKNRDNVDGKKVKVVVTSPLVSEGVDFRFIRQVHILDPHWNMSRIEQVIGRALRTCSHQALPLEEQNCTVYLHIVRAEENRECFDEYTYRTKVETKGMRIAKVRKVLAESAMDCPIQLALPSDWRELVIPQIRDEGHEDVSYKLKDMMAPAFDESPDIEQCKVNPSVLDPTHVRPLSTYLDSRDEILSKVGDLFVDKSIWDRNELITELEPFSREVVIYTLQQAITSAFKFLDSFGRPSVLESKGEMYALAPIGVPNATMIERTTRPSIPHETALPETPAAVEVKTEVADDIIDKRRDAFKWPGDAAARFSESVKNGYIFDHELNPAEKTAYLATKPRLPFSDRLFDVPETDNLIGEDLTRFQQWNKALVAKFIGDKGRIIASLAQNNMYTITPFEITDEVPTRSLGSKSFKPTVCGTGQNSVAKVKDLAKYIDMKGVGIPANLRGAPLCVYAELLSREQHNIVWYTPEEMRALESKDSTKSIQKAFKS
jgi:superfamily II DNA or RNA helicase